MYDASFISKFTDFGLSFMHSKLYR